MSSESVVSISTYDQWEFPPQMSSSGSLGFDRSDAIWETGPSTSTDSDTTYRNSDLGQLDTSLDQFLYEQIFGGVDVDASLSNVPDDVGIGTSAAFRSSPNQTHGDDVPADKRGAHPFSLDTRSQSFEEQDLWARFFNDTQPPEEETTRHGSISPNGESSSLTGNFDRAPGGLSPSTWSDLVGEIDKSSMVSRQDPGGDVIGQRLADGTAPVSGLHSVPVAEDAVDRNEGPLSAGLSSTTFPFVANLQTSTQPAVPTTFHSNFVAQLASSTLRSKQSSESNQSRSPSLPKGQCKRCGTVHSTRFTDLGGGMIACNACRLFLMSHRTPKQTR